MISLSPDRVAEAESHPLADPYVLLHALQQLRATVQTEGQTLFAQWQPLIQRRAFLPSTLNLAHYLALRKRDLRPLQVALMPWGLSSLGRSEARVLPNLDAVIATLGAVCHAPATTLPQRPAVQTFFAGERLLHDNVEALFGPQRTPRRIRIMVTMPTEAASDYTLIRDLLQHGMDCVRINCAHDSPIEWAAMIAHLRQAEAETGHCAQVLMDLGGPKARTGAIIMPDDKRRLVSGDTLLLTRAVPQPDERYPYQAQCMIPEVLDQLAVGGAVWIDDGKLGTEVACLAPEGCVLRVTQTRPKGGKLAPDKGLNFPGTTLRLNPLTDKDREDLDFVATHADIIGYLFVQEAADIEQLHQELQARCPDPARPIALIAKIETPRAVSNLPELIVHAAGKYPFGVMIACGDLAVEIGYQRLAEIQEEILWLCEAAHVPVIWATQVLENLVVKGTPSRAEMTDAAMSERAECVMLNKGPYVLQAVGLLDEVLTRMQEHQLKKTPQLRALRMWLR